jgi:hypothetical protein
LPKDMTRTDSGLLLFRVIDRTNSMPKPKTYFEQVPVEMVKKIAQALPENSVMENQIAPVETQDGTSPQDRWRDVAQKVQREQDPKRMIQLVEQLIATFDEEERGKRLPLTGDGRSRSRPSET